MRRFFAFLIAVLFISVGIIILEREPADPSVTPPSTTTTTLWAEEDIIEVAVRDYTERITREYLDALAAEEARRQKDLEAAMAATRPSTNVASTAPGDCSHIPAWFPQAIAYRESRCSYDAYSPTGCGGYGCIGAFQFDARHFTGWANGQAGCGDLDPWTVDGQNECAWRLSREGTQFGAWGS